MSSCACVSEEIKVKDLKPLFEPKSVAVIGASRNPASVGYAILHNLVNAKFNGPIYPVNPKADTLEGLKSYPSLLDIPGEVDLAVIVIPASAVIETMKQCGQKKVKGVCVISAGFKEIGGEGAKIEKELTELAHTLNIPVVGPNCLGICTMDPKFSLNASFAPTMPPKGSIAFISQSGALATAVLDYARSENIGFSKFVSMGNKADVNETDFLRYLKNDPETKVILLYIEDIKDGEGFMEACREITDDPKNPKPIIVIKSGRTAQGAKAASSHTGSLMGSDEVYDAIFTQSGVIRANSGREMFNFAIGFAFQPVPRGNRVVIVTNAGGPGIMATDACVRAGLQMAEISPETKAELKKVLPPTASLSNPIDVIGDAHYDRYEKTFQILAKDPQVDAVFVILTPQAMTDVVDTAKAVVNFDSQTSLPVVASFMGGPVVEPGVEILEQSEIPHYGFPEEAAKALATMYRFRVWIERQKTVVKNFPVKADVAARVIAEAKKRNQKSLLIHQAMEVFQAYGIPLPSYGFVQTRDEAVAKAKAIGFPVVLKVVSEQVIHKVDVGGVKLNIASEDELKRAYDEMTQKIAATGAKIEGTLVQAMARKGREVILGMNRDPHFGPVMMFGLGGIYVEALKDVSFRIAPIRELSAIHMIESIRAFTILKGVRGEKPADLTAIADCLMRLSQLSMDQTDIQEIDINPLLVFPEKEGALALDARIILA